MEIWAMISGQKGAGTQSLASRISWSKKEDTACKEASIVPSTQNIGILERGVDGLLSYVGASAFK